MPRNGRVSVRSPSCALGLVLAMALVQAPAVGAQSIVAGVLHGEVVDQNGLPLAKTQVTIDNLASGSIQTLTTDREGRFDLTQLTPGTYRILAEQIGYQPVRQGGVRVVPGQATSVRLTLERRPPPITSVAEIPDAPRLLSYAPLAGEAMDEREVHGLEWRRDITDLARGSTIVSEPRDGRNGFAESADGLPEQNSHLSVDGFRELRLRHPFVPGEPVTAPPFSRGALDQARIIGNVYDIEYPAGAGPTLTGYTRRGGNRFRFEPFVTWSGKPGSSLTRDNPGDSSFSSLQAGGVLSGALIRDTAQFVIGGEYQHLERPTAFPWEHDSTAFGGTPVSLRATLPTVASDSFGSTIGNYVNPVIRTWVGGNVFGRADWQIASGYSVMARFNFAKWKEENPQLARDLPSGLGSRLDGRDASAALALTGDWKSASDELRLAFRSSQRDWLSGSLPTTYLVAEGAGFGGPPTLPGNFKTRDIELTNTIHLPAGAFFFKIHGGAVFSRHTQNYHYGAKGIFRFGDLDGFGNGLGDFLQAFSAQSARIFTSKEIFLGGQASYSPGPGRTVLGGFVLQTQRLPRPNPIVPDTVWTRTTGLSNTFEPAKVKRVSPRLGLIWDPGDRHDWVFRGGGGLFYEGLTPDIFGELLRPLRILRAQGAFANWPTGPDTLTGTPVVGTSLTMLSTSYKDPRTTKLDLGVSRSLPGRLNLHLDGSYHHTDYLPRRSDLNRLLAPTGLTQEQRPIYGTLVKQGGLVSALPGSNRRFSGFDLVSGIAPTGFSNYYGLTVELERTATVGLSYSIAYTYSRTRDNWPSGPTGDPADQLSPFPEDPISSEWVSGRSDFDIPHRATVAAEYRFRGRLGVTLSARYRYRSGLPFTPGFQPGVDVNGDGSGNNDPAFISPAAVTGLQPLIDANSCLASQVNGFAARNSCRDPAMHSLDLRLQLGLPIASLKDRAELTIDVLNLVGTESGIRDHAVALVDPSPASPLLTDPLGNVTLPLIANPRFGTLLSRRGENRLIRFGLRLGY